MAIVDERGRLFGKINIIDFAVVLFIAVLIPLAYAAFVLFRTPAPRVVSVSPSTVPFARDVEQKVAVTGESLRPFLRAKLDTLDARGFTAQSPTAGELRFINIPPGTYDIVLLDESQELMRLPKALTVAMPPIQMIGWIEAPPTSSALAPGASLGPSDNPVRLVSLSPDQVQGRTRAMVRAECPLSPANECIVAGTPVKAGTVLKLPIASQSDSVVFQVDSVRRDAQWLDVTVRIMGLPASLSQLREGDVDLHVDVASPDPPAAAGVLNGAVITSLGELLKNQGQFAVTTSRPQVVGEVSAYSSLAATMTVDAQVAQLLVPIEGKRLKYRDVEIRPGNIIPFETDRYRVQAIIMTVAGGNEPSASGTRR